MATHNPKVAGSNPAPATNKGPVLQGLCWLITTIWIKNRCLATNFGYQTRWPIFVASAFLGAITRRLRPPPVRCPPRGSRPIPEASETLPKGPADQRLATDAETESTDGMSGPIPPPWDAEPVQQQDELASSEAN